MDEISAATMWKCSKHYCDKFISFFGKRLIVPESCITELEQNHVPPKFESIILDDKKIHFWTKPLDKLLIRSLLSKFSETTNEKNLYNTFSQIDILVGGNRGQGTFRSVGKFIMRDK